MIGYDKRALPTDNKGEKIITLELWAAFVAVVIVFTLIPGPTVILVVGQAISHEKKSVLPLVCGEIS